MAVIEYRKVKCDECGKEEEIKYGGTKPTNWFEISITQWSGNNGDGRLNREVCNEECALKLMKKLKEIPKQENYIY